MEACGVVAREKSSGRGKLRPTGVLRHVQFIIWGSRPQEQASSHHHPAEASRSHEQIILHHAEPDAHNSRPSSPSSTSLVCCSLLNDRCSALEGDEFMSSVESLRHAALTAKQDQLVSTIAHLRTARSSRHFAPLVQFVWRICDAKWSSCDANVLHRSRSHRRILRSYARCWPSTTPSTITPASTRW